jgi:hypothetical protein
MSELIGQHQQATFVTPTNGTTADADQVRGNLNTQASSYNAHDSDGGVHFQSGLHANRPAAGNTGHKWLSTDTLKVFYDNGTTWQEIGYLPSVGGTLSGGLTISTGGLTITAGGLTVTAGGFTLTAGNLEVDGGQAVAKRFDAGDTGTAKTIDFNNGNVQKVRLTGNVTFTFSNPSAGASYMLELLQDATGSRTVTWPSTVKWSDGGTAPTITGTANRKTVVVFVYNGTNYLGVVFGLNFDETT